MTFAEKLRADELIRAAKKAALDVWAADFAAIIDGLKSAVVSVEATNAMIAALSEKSGLSVRGVMHEVQEYARAREIRLPGD